MIDILFWLSMLVVTIYLYMSGENDLKDSDDD